MKQETKQIILSIIFWLSISIPTARWGHHNDNLGENTFILLDMAMGVFLYGLSLTLAKWFIGDKKEE